MMASSINLFALLVVCIFASLASSKNWQLKSRIVGGSSAVEKQFPYQVSLRQKKNDKHFCGASIINPQYILTAAHCFFRLPANTALIYGIVNKTHASERGTYIELSTLMIHKDFSVQTPQPDIALIRTKEPIVFSEFVQSINLPIEEFIKPGTKAIISGWGMVEAPKSSKEMLFSPKYPSALQYKETSTISLEECLADFEPMKNSDYMEWEESVEGINDGVICTRNVNGTGVCLGDSGGPLVVNNTLIGLVSWSIGCANGYPGIHTRIFPHLEWINKTINETDSYVK